MSTYYKIPPGVHAVQYTGIVEHFITEARIAELMNQGRVVVDDGLVYVVPPPPTPPIPVNVSDWVLINDDGSIGVVTDAAFQAEYAASRTEAYNKP
jgi:hypothetical protein